MTKTENAAIILLADELNEVTRRCRNLERGMVQLFKENEKLRGKLKKQSGVGSGYLGNVNI